MKNNYCAIVVDEEIPAKRFVKDIGLSADLVYPLYELKTCIKDINYDALVCVSGDFRGQIGYDDLSNYVQRCGCPQNKFVHVHPMEGTGNFLLERALNYYDEHSDEIEMFATGNSYTPAGLDTNCLKYKLLNFGISSQDLYYGYQIAKRVMTLTRRGIPLRSDWNGGL